LAQRANNQYYYYDHNCVQEFVADTARDAQAMSHAAAEAGHAERSQQHRTVTGGPGQNGRGAACRAWSTGCHWTENYSSVDCGLRLGPF